MLLHPIDFTIVYEAQTRAAESIAIIICKKAKEHYLNADLATFDDYCIKVSAPKFPRNYVFAFQRHGIHCIYIVSFGSNLGYQLPRQADSCTYFVGK
jgi:hypothetical protein